MARTSARLLITNTASSYVRLGVVVIVGLVTVPILLAQLGIADYGLFSLLSATLAIALAVQDGLVVSAQVFLARAIAKEDAKEASAVFNTLLVLLLAFAMLLVLAGLMGGPWLLERFHIPPERRWSASVCYYIILANAGLAVVASAVRIPFVARQDLVLDNSLELVNSVSGLGSALVLIVVPGDKLLWYAAFQIVRIALLAVLQGWMASRRYPEVRVLPTAITRKHLREVGQYAAWTIFGDVSWRAGRNGIQVVLNLWLGPAANAAYAIALQVAALFSKFTGAILRPVAPALAHLDEAGEAHRFARLVLSSSKVAALAGLPLLAVFAFVGEDLLRLWLPVVPMHAKMFAVTTLVAATLDLSSRGMFLGLRAKKLVRAEVLTSSGLYLLPLLWLVAGLWTGVGISVYPWAVIGSSLIGLAVRVIVFSRVLGTTVRDWASEVGGRLAAVAAGVGLAGGLTALPLDHLGIHFGWVVLVIGAVFAPMAWRIGLGTAERQHIAAAVAGWAMQKKT